MFNLAIDSKLRACDFLFPGRIHASPHLSTRQSGFSIEAMRTINYSFPVSSRNMQTDREKAGIDAVWEHTGAGRGFPGTSRAGDADMAQAVREGARRVGEMTEMVGNLKGLPSEGRGAGGAPSTDRGFQQALPPRGCVIIKSKARM